MPNNLSARAYGLMVKKARDLARSLGMRRAAGYLRNRQVSFDVAHQALLGVPPRFS